MSIPELTIDTEFETLLVPLAEEALHLLREQILRDGCREPLSVWRMDDGGRILLDGHNRYKICTDINQRYSTVNIRLESREHAKLWILERQAGRRHLTDDQRAIVWNEIREQRSAIVQAEKLQKARDVKAGASISAKSTEIEQPKKDTRAEIAEEAKLSESKLRLAQKLKKHPPELYKKVLSGELTLRGVPKELEKGRKKTETRKDSDYFRRISRMLDGVFKGRVKEMLDDLVDPEQKDITPAMKKGLQQIILILGEFSKHADVYVTKFKAILQSREKTP
jgi:hypothetical protein